MTTFERDRAEFVSRVTADVTHELRNVLAIVKETAGLVSDIMATDQPQSLNRDKLSDLAGRIEMQADRGTRLVAAIRELNRAGEQPDRAMDLNDIAQQVTVMCNRRAKKKRQSVQVTRQHGEIRVAGDRLAVYMALHTAVECCLTLLPEAAVLDLDVGRAARGAILSMAGSSDGSPVAMDSGLETTWNQLGQAVSSVDAALEVAADRSQIQIVFQGNASDQDPRT
jgi:hypothetical protein